MVAAKQKSKLTRMVNDFVAARNEITRRGNATELSYGPDLKTLLARLTDELGVPVNVDYHPNTLHQASSKQADFKISSVKTTNPVGVLECKAPQTRLDYDEQLKKYENISANIVWTDFYQFKRYRDGILMGEAELSARPTENERENLLELLKRWLRANPKQITNSELLAELLAERCHDLKNELLAVLPDDQSGLKGLFKEMQKAIYSTFGEAQFADAIAQTFVFALLIAKLEAPEDDRISVYNIRKYIGRKFELISEIVRFLPDLEQSEYDRIQKITEEVTDIINGVDTVSLGEAMSFKGYRHEDAFDDPYIYFYQTFLRRYDPDSHKKLGVYFTPPPVVKFIVRAVDDILKRDFKLKNGLASKRVTALDFAAGTGTFLLEMMRLVLEREKDATQLKTLKKHLVKNFYGLELLVAPYTMTHFKLSQYLNDKGVALEQNERLKVYLANTLEDAQGQYSPLVPALAKESEGARAVKSNQILVIAGNPPYSRVSQNRSEAADKMVDAYKIVDGKPLNEKKSDLLDDYVKFIRFAQMKMDNADEGIVAIITNHAFLNNPTFRGMRQSLMQTFNRLYFLDLHGHTKKREKNPAGGVDENVFEIQQGVAISLFIKKKGMKRGLFHADMWGDRDSKYERCKKIKMNKVNWTRIKPVSEFYLFIPREEGLDDEYKKLRSIKDIFNSGSTGIITSRNQLAIGYDKAELLNLIEAFANRKSHAETVKKLRLTDSRGWHIDAARNALNKLDNKEDFCKLIAFRPFDERHVFYHIQATDWGRWKSVMKDMLPGDNLGLVSVRQVAENEFNHVMIADTIVDYRMTLSNRGGAYLYPLYVHPNGNGNGNGANGDCMQNGLEEEYNGRRENFKLAFRKWIDDRYGKHYSPEDILGCVYAIMHSPTYRERYREFLRIDFPRVPFPESNADFERLAAIGRRLIDAHLLRANCDGKVKMLGEGDDYTVGRVRYDEAEQRLYFNTSKYLAPISPELAELQIGGYKPLEKYLKSRKGRDVFGDLERLQQIGNALQFTLAEIERLPDFL